MPQSTSENQQAQPTPEIKDKIIRKAYEFVALSSGIAIQDATDNLRNINTLSTTIIAAAMAQSLEHPGSTDDMQKIIEMAHKVSDEASSNFERVNKNATSMLKNFPLNS